MSTIPSQFETWLEVEVSQNDLLKLKYLNMIFCSFSVVLFLVPIVSFCSYLILISKKMQHLIHKSVVYKGWSQPKNLQRLCILFHRIKENFLHPPRLSHFQEFSNPSFIITPIPRLSNFQEFSNPPLILTTLLLSIQEYKTYTSQFHEPTFSGLENDGIILFYSLFNVNTQHKLL